MMDQSEFPSTSSEKPFEENSKEKIIVEDELQDVSHEKQLESFEKSSLDGVKLTEKEIAIDCNLQSKAPNPAIPTTGETTNQSRLEQMIAGPCTSLLRAILTVKHPPLDLLNIIQSHKKKILEKSHRDLCKEVEKKLQHKQDYSDFDITLLYFVLRNLCGYKREIISWMNQKTLSGRTVKKLLEKLRNMKNNIKSHKPNLSTPNFEYESTCNDLELIVNDLNEYAKNGKDYKQAIGMLKIISMDPDERKDFKRDIEKIRDGRLTWTESITSKESADLFKSFNVDFAMDYPSCSFDCKDILKTLEKKIKSLQKKVILTKESGQSEDKKSFRVLVFEVEVDFNGDDFYVVERGDKTEDFFEFNENHQAKVILITSNNIPIVKTKLVVYREYSGYSKAITSNNIFLHHDFEDIDEVAKFCASKRLSSYCEFFESAIKTLTENDFRFAERQSIPDRENKTRGKSFGTLEIEREWKNWVDNEIQKMKGNKPNGNDAFEETKQKYQKLEKELTNILKQLEEFKAKIFLADQNELIEECLKGEIVQNSIELRKNKSIAKYIVGCRSDKNPVAKVFLNKDDEEAKQLFESCCSKVWEGMQFEYVNIENFRPEDEQMIKLESAIDVTGRKKLREFVSKNADKIMARYSTIASVVPYEDEKQQPLSIVLYSLDKDLIPFGEKPLPTYLAKWPCILKEGIALLTTGCNICKCSKHIKAGCSIGIPRVPKSGSVGFFVEKKHHLMNTFEHGFLTASHVAVDDFQNLYQDKKLLSVHPLREKNHPIVHPSWEDDSEIASEVGDVFESFFGNYGQNENGLDLAVVKLRNFTQEGKKETLEVVREDDLKIGEHMKVMKCGKATGTTYGYLSSCNVAVRVNAPFPSNKYFIFNNCYAVRGDEQEKPLFGVGDSGSGVFVVENGKALGIAFSGLGPYMIVCKIDEFLEKNNMKLVRYVENTEESMESV